MSTLVPTERSWLTQPRVVGTPLHWARGTAMLGGLVGAWAPAALMAFLGLLAGGLPLWGQLLLALPSLLVGALLGGALGLVQPALLDRVRGRVRLPVLALAQAGVGAAVGAAAGAMFPLSLGGFCWLMGIGDLEAFWMLGLWMGGTGAGTGALTALTWWLPFTMASVLRVRTWPITLAAAAISPVWAVLSMFWVVLVWVLL